jgi:propanediol dehydratase large subunit
MAKRQKRFLVLADRPVNKDGFIKEWIDVGLVAMDSPNDPKPSIKITNGEVVELDGKSRDDFDMIDTFIADHCIDKTVAQEAMAIDSVKFARMMVDINVPRAEIVRLSVGLTPAKVVAILRELNVVELMMAMQKLRSRKQPMNQAHITNLKDSAPLLAADAAEAAYRGFAEIETTVGVGRYAPMNALALLVGGQTGRPGVLAQCAVEEALELSMGMRGLTHYAETVSVYGTEQVFIDGDDTPWSKSFLASAYASRGLKMRYTSGTGSEVQMGYAEGKSMLYLEVRCVMITKGAGVQGLQNGSISCIGVPGSVPAGIKTVLAENVATVLMNLEVASGNDQTFTHSIERNTARMLMQFLPGTDFVFSGYAAEPNYDNMFAGSTHDVDDYDDFLVLQRDLQVDGGLVPVTEEGVIAVRNKAARALQVVFDELGLPPITDEEVDLVTYAHGSKDIGDRNVPEDLRAIDDFMKRGSTGLDVVRALAKRGFKDVADAVLRMQIGKVAGDYLQTSAVYTDKFEVLSAINNANDYEGPGTGYRLEGERWEKLKNIPQAIDPKDI